MDFQGITRLIDVVLAAEPSCLPTLLRVLSTSDDRFELFVVLDIVVRCRDPLAPLSTLCRDAMKAAADLDLLLRRSNWERIEEICALPRANAILNLCDAGLQQANPHSERRRKCLRIVRPRLKVCAVEELNARGSEIERVRESREAVLPDLWTLLKTHIPKKKLRSSSESS